MHKKGDLRRSLNLDTLNWMWLGIYLLFWSIRDRIWKFELVYRSFGGYYSPSFGLRHGLEESEGLNPWSLSSRVFIFVIRDRFSLLRPDYAPLEHATIIYKIDKVIQCSQVRRTCALPR